MSDQLRFDGKVVLVTGAGNGLGRTHALLFGSRGAKVVVNDLGGGAHGDGKSSAAADKVVAEIKALGGDAVANYDSVTDGDKIVQTAMDTFGRIDVVINNAGILRDVSFAKMTEADWELIYKVHVYGAFKVTHAAWPHLRAQNYGRVIFTASAAGIYGNFGQANYSMAKLGLHGMSQTLALEGRKNNVHVNTIAPVAGSRLTETILPPELIAALKPEYVSPLVAYLCHEDTKETGGLFEVGAGYHGKLRWERTVGHMFPIGRELTPEAVQAHWGAITDFSKTTHPSNTNESMEPALANLNRKSRGSNQFLDLDAAFADEINVESKYDERDLALYALGVGAARDALDKSELKYVYELGDGFQALPTYAVMPPLNAFLNLGRDGKMLKGLNYGLDRVLHGEQFTEVYRPLSRNAKLKHKFKLKDAWDKEKNAVVVLACDTFDESGEKVAYNEIGIFVRGAGGFGGERGPSADINVPPSREPDAVIEEKTDPNQTLLYRLSGDWNPLHADPAFAKAFGFDKPILHGLCTFGHVGRHVLKAFCDNDGRKFKNIKVRFADSVFPGETLVTRMWKESDQKIVFETKVKERDKVVIRNAAIELYQEIPAVKAKPAAASAVAAAAPAASNEPTSADIFAAIGKHLAATKGLGDQVKTVFQFKLSAPDSAVYLDMKSGDGTVATGNAEKPDVTLELADSDFIAMSTGKADPNKLYFGGKMKVSGNVMASQKLGFLQKLDPKLLAEVVAARVAKGGGAAPAAAPAASAAGPSSSDVFAVIAKHLEVTKGLGDQVKTVFQFKLSNPDTAVYLDMKAGDGKVVNGTADKADVTLELADSDFVDMCTGKADPNKLYFGGKMKVSGNVMASQKLAFLQKIDPKLMDAVKSGGGGAAAKPAAAAASAPAASKSGRAGEVFAALGKRLASDPKAAKGTNQVVQFKVREPDATFVVDFTMSPAKISGDINGHKPAAVFTVADEDLVRLADGTAKAQDLYQRGKLRVDGDVSLAKQLSFLDKLV